MDAQLRIAELEAERARSQRLELQIGELLEQVAALTARVAALTERLGQNSRNSHLPPSSDPTCNTRGATPTCGASVVIVSPGRRHSTA